MENYLVRPIMIEDHPVGFLEPRLRHCYVKALGEFLCYLTRDNRRVRLAFEAWSLSIYGSVPVDAWSYTSEFDCLNDGLAVYGGEEADTIRQSFLFDCFYLLEKSGADLLLNAYTFLLGKIKGRFTKDALNHAYNYFKGSSTGGHLPSALRKHRKKSNSFALKKTKRVMIAATMSAGKSTLVNALVGHHINRMQSTACTSRAHYIYNKPSGEGAIVNFAGNKFLYTYDFSLIRSEGIEAVGIPFLSSLSDERICLIDTPGVNYSGDETHGEITRELIRGNDYDILVLVLNASQLAINDERELMAFVGANCRKRVITVLNQCDRFNPSRDSIRTALEVTANQMKQSGLQSPLVIPVSALAALLSRLEADPSYEMDEDDEYELNRMARRMEKSYFHLPLYLPGVPQDTPLPGILERSGITYLEHLLLSL